MNLKKILPRDKFPQLYSKRGFEMKTIRIVFPYSRSKLAYITDLKGNKLHEL